MKRGVIIPYAENAVNPCTCIPREEYDKEGGDTQHQ